MLTAGSFNNRVFIVKPGYKRMSHFNIRTMVRREAKAAAGLYNATERPYTHPKQRASSPVAHRPWSEPARGTVGRSNERRRRDYTHRTMSSRRCPQSKVNYVVGTVTATGWAQCAQRRASIGISLRHSGHFFVAGGAGAGALRDLMRCSSQLIGITTPK